MDVVAIKDFNKLEKRYRTNLINSLSGFKSVNLVGTQNKEGVTNLSIISSVVHLGANPALMGFIMRPVSVTRDTYNNILSTKFYTFNHIQANFVKAAHQTAARYASERSEFEAVGLTPEYKTGFSAPFVKESSIQIGLEFKEQLPISLNNTILMIGAVRVIYAPKACIASDGYIDIEQAGSISCSGLDSYHTTKKLVRLSYAKPDKPLTEL